MAELERELSSTELVEWQAYWMLEPWGAIRDDLHAARIESLLFNVHRGKSQKAAKPADFMYRDTWQQADDERAELIANARAFIRGNNASDR